MTIENFKAMYPVDQVALKESIARKKNSVESDVATLSRQLILEASYGLSEAFEGYSNENIAYAPDANLFAKMPEILREKAKLHFAAIIFGLSIISLEGALLTGKLNMGEFADGYNYAISKTPLKRNRNRQDQLIDLSREEMAALYANIGKDTTFNGFFETKEGVDSIPTTLKTIITGENLYHIRKDILPMFNERAKLLAK